MNSLSSTETKVGLFVAAGAGLLMAAILLLGGGNDIFESKLTYYVHMNAVDGLVEGAKVVLNGIRVGTVKKIDFSTEKKDVQVELKVLKKFRIWIRQDTTAEILTQGVLGDKYVALSKGSETEGELLSDSEIPNRPTKDFAQFLTKGDQLVVTLNSIAGSMDRLLKTFETANRSETFFQGLALTAKNLSQASAKLNSELEKGGINSSIKNLNAILDKINNGTGTLGALVNDPTLYYDAKALMGGVNRNRIMRNLVRKTIKDGDDAQEK